MRRVVVTGMGIVSSIGNNTQEVLASLREAKSGIVRADKYAELGFRCQVHGAPNLDPEEVVDRRAMRFLGGGAAWNHIAMEQAIRDSGVEESDISNVRSGIIMGSGGPSCRAPSSRRLIRTHGKRPQARRPLRGAESDVVDSVGDARHLVQDQGRELFDLVGLRDLQSLHWQRRRAHSVGQTGHGLRRRLRGSGLDAVGSVRRNGRHVIEVNDTPTRPRAPTTRTATASLSPAAPACWCWKSSNTPRPRGAKIYAEVAGYGATSDGYDMVAPSGEGAQRCMKMALETCKAPIDYINPHATATPVGDLKEIEAIRAVFGAKCPPISATKSLSGHSLGATGVAGGDLFAANDAERIHLRERQYREPRSGVRRHADRARAPRQREDRRVLSNSFGFGGTNASVVFKRLDA